MRLKFLLLKVLHVYAFSDYTVLYLFYHKMLKMSNDCKIYNFMNILNFSDIAHGIVTQFS